MLQYTSPGLTIVGSGSATPIAPLSNAQLSTVVDTSDEWIASRTGIRQRQVASSNTALADLAAQAATQALSAAAIAPTEVDMVLLATSTPDDLFGSAAQVQAQLGATQAVAFDLTAACSGFIFGLVTAAQYIRTGTYRTIVLIGADVLSRWVDWDDRRTCVLFGDGAGAVVLRADHDRDNLLGFELRSDGSLNRCLNLGYQGESRSLVAEVDVNQGQYHPITMNGQEVYRFAVRRVPEVVEKALFRADLTTAQVDWLLLHQANQRILDAVANRLKIPAEKVISNMANYGNTSAASIPLALDEVVRSGRVQPSDIIATAGFGAGLSWGSAIFRWG